MAQTPELLYNEVLNRSLMQLIKNECGHKIKSIYRNLELPALDNRVQSLSNVKEEFRPNNQYTAYSLYDELRSMYFSANEYRLLYIYFINTDSVVSSEGNMSLELYHSIYCKGLDISLEELRDFLSRKNVMFKKPIMILIMFTMFFSGGMIPFYLTLKDAFLKYEKEHLKSFRGRACLPDAPGGVQPGGKDVPKLL